MTVKPITPDEVVSEKIKHIPDVVIETFNKHIALNFNGGESTVKLKNILSDLVTYTLTREEIYKNKYLDIEDVYENAGWIVKFDQPAYNENYDSYYTFKKKK